MIMNGQMELSLEAGRGRAARNRVRRAGRAGWWFERMRQVVDRALDWPAAPEPALRPEKAGCAATGQGEAAVSRLRVDARQICE